MIKKNITLSFAFKNILLICFITFTSSAISQPVINSTAENSGNINLQSESLVETKFERLSTEHGLSNNSIRCINQDNTGFIWIGTEKGLNKYDGKAIKNYYNKENDSFSISYNKFDEIYKDTDSNIWMTTANGELIKYDYEFEKFINYKLLDNIHGKDWFTSVVDDGKGSLVLGSSTGLHLFDKSTGKSIFMLSKNNLNGYIQPYGVTCLLKDNVNNLWVGTAFLGLFMLDSNNNIIKHFKNDSTNNSSLSNNQIRDIFLDSKNSIWVGTGNGLNLYNKEENNFFVYKNDPDNSLSISHNNVTSICEDKNNVIWIGTRRGGLSKFLGSGNFINYKNDEGDIGSLSNDHIDNLFVDKSNVLWIGTFGGGISKLDCQQKKFFLISKLFKNNVNNFQCSVGSISEDSSGSILVTIRFSDGIFKFGKHDNNSLYYKGFEFISKVITESILGRILEMNKGIIWLNSFFGELIEYDLKNHKLINLFKVDKFRFNEICVKDNFLYIGTENRGILKFDINKKEFVPLDSVLSVNLNLNILDLLTDKKNNLWICTIQNGIYRYEFEKNSLTNFKSEENNINSISENHTTSVYEDSHGNIWIGTNNRGLNKYNESENNFARYGTDLGLPDVISGILEDNYGKIWLRSFDGLYVFDPVNKKAIKYDKSDCLQRYDFASNVCFKDKGGQLYFGGSGGLTYFNPAEIKNNPYVPNVVFTDFQIFNESIKPSPENPFLKKNITVSEDITLSYKESVFSIEFAAMVYNNPGKNQYAYMMEGFDKDWVYCGTRRNVTYTNLDPGNYTFRVKGSNNDGIWNVQETSIRISISPPWWQTWWFKSCGAVSIFLLAGYGYKKRITKLKNEKQAQEEFSKKLLNSQEEERKKIASVLHDSIAHEVLITKNSSELGLRSAGENEEVKEILNKISERSSSTLDQLRRIQFNLHPYEVEKLGLTKAIKSIFDRVSKSTEIKFTFEEDYIDKVFSEENEIHLYRIIQEAINNILKHSSATKAGIKITRTEENVYISISDNGKGFSMNYALRKNSMGLSGISERIKLLGGNLDINSESGNGTFLKISLPVVKTS